MLVAETKLEGVLLIEPKSFGDARGYFFESWQEDRYSKAGIPHLVQDNISYSERGVLRGLHCQAPKAQGKLVQVLAGEVYDVAVDIRKGSRTFGEWVAVILNDKNRRQLFVPAGYAHGFQVLSPSAVFHYRCTEYYDPGGEFTLAWNDPDVGITWPFQAPLLSSKDACGLSLGQV